MNIRVVRASSESASKDWRFRLWPPGVTVIAITVALAALVAILHSFTLGRIAQYEKMTTEQETRLESYRKTVMRLETTLTRAQITVSKVAKLAGIDYDPSVSATFTVDSLADGEAEGHAQSSIAETSAPARRDFSIPVGLPLQGAVSRGFHVQKGPDDKGPHQGIDIPAKTGTPVLSTASGVVVFAGPDSVFGKTVIVKHNDSITTLYGHNSKLLLKEGETVMAGGRVALSGNSGRSTAPHLHYEIRIHDTAVDPTPFLGGVRVDDE